MPLADPYFWKVEMAVEMPGMKFQEVNISTVSNFAVSDSWGYFLLGGKSPSFKRKLRVILHWLSHVS